MHDLVPARKNIATIAQRASGDYSHITSLDQIKPPYPEQFTADWWALRKRVMELIAARQARLRGGEKCTQEERELSDCATGVSEGDEAATSKYEAIDPETGLHVRLSPALRHLRDHDPARFVAISNEAKRLQGLGRPKVITHLAKRFP